VDTLIRPHHIQFMKRFLVTFGVSAAMLLGLEISAGALPNVLEAKSARNSASDRARDRRNRRRVIRPAPVIPQQSPTRNPDYPSVPLPPPSTAVSPSVRR
jgi:hypothetical protein